jgi:type IV secretory pathway VirB10-like protein
LQERLVRNLQRQEASINEFLGGTDSNLRLRTDFKVGALEEVIANSEINREPVPVPAQAVASPIEPAAQPPQPAPELPPVIQLTDTDSAAKPEAVQAKPDPKAKAEELKLKQAQAAEEKKQLQEQKRAAAAKAREEKLLEKKKPVEKNKASPETRQFIDNIMKQNEAP